jgi:diguanylate cyclase (GGDEF)-like protein/PAS domain S-box-containing protein
MSGEPIKVILLVENCAEDASSLRATFQRQSATEIEVIHARSMADAETLLAQRAVSIILLDLQLPDARGLGAVRRAHAAAPRVPLVVLGVEDDAMAAQALREGAQDYLVKAEVEPRGLLRSLRYALERKTMQETLSMERERAQVTLNSIGDAVISIDTSGNVIFLNAVAEKMTGWPCQEALGIPLAHIYRVTDDNYHEGGENHGATGASQDPPSLADCILKRRDGVEIPIEDSVTPIQDETGRTTGAVIAFRDVSAAKAMTLQMAHSAQHDFLTGLPNRMLFADRVKQAISTATRHSKKVAVMFLDLDGFKGVNDTLGHSVGDRLLKSIAERLVRCVRGSDTVSRQGGDEFVVLLAAIEQAEDAAITARRILQAVTESHSIDRHEVHAAISIGISIFPDDGFDSETLIASADTAMYQAKEIGGQNYQFFRAAMNLRAVQRQSIEESLRQALEREEFTVHYQPKINLTSGEITGAEALLRWTHPTRGLVSPTEFIPVAEDCGLMVPIGRWLLREVCRQARSWAAHGLPMPRISVNISTLEFRNESFVQNVFATLREAGLAPESLELELTEGALMKHVESTQTILNALRAAGVQIAVDDFGTGYSSLGYLRKLPIDALKIDRSFIRQINSAAPETTMVTALISMGHNLKLRVIGEGVETQEEMAFLQSHQCEEAQGYYFSPGVPGAEFAKLLMMGIFETALAHH